MKIAIHHRDGSFSAYWVEYCKKNGIPYKIVNAFDDNIIEQMNDCDALMWHHHQGSQSDCLIAKQILFALEQSGKIVFPDFNSGWHFDDKVGQKYLLEANNLPVVPSHAFYDKKAAIKWSETSDYPVVFKLRGGAGSRNVILIHNRKEAEKIIKRCWGKGFKEFDFWGNIKYQYTKYRTGRITLRNLVNFSAGELIKQFKRVNNREHGYAYFQKYIPNNRFDIRVIVIGDKAFAIKRLCRDNDFRASGSGMILYAKTEIPVRCVEKSFEAAKKLGTQCVGFDWVFDSNGNPLIVEISYGFMAKGYFTCEGYWTSDMQWHEGSNFDFCGWMVNEVINRMKK